MTEKMKAAFVATEKLDPQMQDQIAERLLDIIDNEQWHAMMRDPRSERIFDTLLAADEAAQANGDSGRSLEELLGVWDQQHGITR